MLIIVDKIEIIVDTIEITIDKIERIIDEIEIIVDKIEIIDKSPWVFYCYNSSNSMIIILK